MSWDTARANSLVDRGTLEPGIVGDLSVIDLPALRLHGPEAVNDLPGGRRLLQRVDGYRPHRQADEVIVTTGSDTGARPGRLVRGGSAP